MQDGQKDVTFTVMKVKYTVATCEKDNTLMHALGPNNVPLVLKIVRFWRSLTLSHKSVQLKTFFRVTLGKQLFVVSEMLTLMLVP